jgi:hypothetical protein
MDTAMKWGISFVTTVSGSTVVSLQLQLSCYTSGLTLNRKGIRS